MAFVPSRPPQAVAPQNKPSTHLGFAKHSFASGQLLAMQSRQLPGVAPPKPPVLVPPLPAEPPVLVPPLPAVPPVNVPPVNVPPLLPVPPVIMLPPNPPPTPPE